MMVLRICKSAAVVQTLPRGTGPMDELVASRWSVGDRGGPGSGVRGLHDGVMVLKTGLEMRAVKKERERVELTGLVGAFGGLDSHGFGLNQAWIHDLALVGCSGRARQGWKSECYRLIHTENGIRSYTYHKPSWRAPTNRHPAKSLIGSKQMRYGHRCSSKNCSIPQIAAQRIA